jgi:hypothetical protein
MDRRGFIAGAAAAIPAAGAAAVRGPEGSATAIASYVTGLRDHVGARDPLPAVGARVGLVREAERAYDPFSIAVVAPGGRRLGYLPPRQGQVLAPLMDAGLGFEARVSSAQIGSAPHLRLAITSGRFAS